MVKKTSQGLILFSLVNIFRRRPTSHYMKFYTLYAVVEACLIGLFDEHGVGGRMNLIYNKNA